MNKIKEFNKLKTFFSIKSNTQTLRFLLLLARPCSQIDKTTNILLVLRTRIEQQTISLSLPTAIINKYTRYTHRQVLSAILQNAYNC